MSRDKFEMDRTHTVNTHTHTHTLSHTHTKHTHHLQDADIQNVSKKCLMSDKG